MAVYGTCPSCKNRASLLAFERQGKIERMRRTGWIEVECPACRARFSFDPLPVIPKNRAFIGGIVVLSVLLLLSIPLYVLFR
ncbi:MAG: hypothetical protein M3M96_01320 [Candidatus Eremiobacteraeota bacterium]|nr:hypothetical protein [Candidatus Eremiobacteraeota bacterium]